MPDQSFLPDLPALALSRRGAAWLNEDGEIEQISLDEAAVRARHNPPILVHGKSAASRLGCERFPAYDLLELFAFTYPARFCLPTVSGLCTALSIDVPGSLDDEVIALTKCCEALLRELGGRSKERDRTAQPIAEAMFDSGWPWAAPVLFSLGVVEIGEPRPVRTAGLAVWSRIAQWEDDGPPPPPDNRAVPEDAARARLSDMLGTNAEERPSQSDYASAVSAAFQPRAEEGEPNVVLAEAGTGVGKTLGYIAPASVWAEVNKGSVWVSTYTRNLQHQIDTELDRLFPDRGEKAEKVVIRKGRENYLCILNLEEAVRVLPTAPQFGIAVALMARWALHTRDGDMVGGDFPSWLSDLLGRNRTMGLADRRGECVYSACPHYGKCFIERSVRKARHAEIVVANHALVMIQAAMGGVDDQNVPTRYVFDEGHHLFEAADSAFASHLTALETVDLRRWIMGAEGRRSGRARGLKRRIEDLIADDEEALDLVEAINDAARTLPAEGWMTRLSEGQPRGAAETFLSLARAQVYARVDGAGNPYSLETDAKPTLDGVVEAGAILDRELGRILEPIQALRQQLLARLDKDADELDGNTRLRIEAIARSLTRRGEAMIGGWRSMLKGLDQETPPNFVDWFQIERIDGRDMDLGMYRHWIDPTVPFTETVAKPAHGLVVTSATLRDGSGDVDQDWAAAEARGGAAHLESPAIRAAVASPFDYPNHTQVYIVGDVRKDDMGQVASAYRELFKASGGGALGLFTAIQRLREVHRQIAGPMDDEGLDLYAQHVDGMDISTLIDIFRAEEDTCLLGTDAVRDGVDVPGRSLRLIVFDRVPWPRPNILYRSRREAFGKNAYTDMLTRLKLKQAFGRLVRRADDKGVFVLLDPMMPSRLLGAFPEGVEIKRCGLAEAIAGTKAFLNQDKL